MEGDFLNLTNKRGYLNKDFQLFHIKDKKNMKFEFHYHDFNKIIIFLSGKVTYLIEGKSYNLKPWDILFISSSEVHKPLIDSTEEYERVVIWINSEFLKKHNISDCDLLTCFQLAVERKFNLLRLNKEMLRCVEYTLENLEKSYESNEFGSHILKNSLFLELIVYLNRLFLGTENIMELNDIVYDEKIENSCCDIITYGIHTPADFMAKNIKYNLNGVSFTLNFCASETPIKLNIPGKFNIYNILATIAACYFSGLPISSIINELPYINGAKGRFEYIPNENENLLIVDYAHSPDSLKNILTSVNELKPKRTILVFGCGGDRDKLKRSIMGEIAGTYADYCIITSDNPRNENPYNIINDIEKGIRKTTCPYEKIEDRKNAIITALNFAKPGDAVIIAGKGHENYQIIEDQVVPFDDAEIIKEYLGGLIESEEVRLPLTSISKELEEKLMKY